MKINMKTFKNVSKNINNMTEEQQIAELKTNPYRIQSIERPSEAVKLAAVQYSYGWAIHCIHAPSKQLQLAAVQINGSTISRIRSPSKTVLITAMLKLIQEHNFYLLKQIIEKNEHNNWPEIETIKKSLKHDGLLESIDINAMTEDEQIKHVEQDPFEIKFISNPSEKVQLAAVQQTGLAIKYIKNPSLEVQLTAVQKYPYAIKYIKNPSEPVQLASVRQYEYAISYIPNPTRSVVITVMLKLIQEHNFRLLKQIIQQYEQNNWIELETIKNSLKHDGLLEMMKTNTGTNVSEPAQLSAVKKNGLTIRFIKNPTLIVQLAAIDQNYQAIQYIDKPLPKVQAFAVTKDYRSLQYLSTASNDIKMIAVKHDGRALQFIKHPSEELQVAAINQNPSIIIYFKNITVKILNICKLHIIDAINYYKKSNIAVADKMIEVLKSHNINWDELMSDREIAYLDEANENINDMSEQAQIKLIQKDPFKIQYIKNPSESVQMTAVQENGNAIRYIDNQSLEFQLAAVKNDRYAIYFIKKPYKSTVITAILTLIKNGNYDDVTVLIDEYDHNNWPELEIIKQSMKADGKLLETVNYNNMSEQEQIKHAQCNPFEIKFISNPSEKVQLAAVQQDGWTIQSIDNPSEKVQLVAVQNNGHVIEYIENPTKNVVITAILRLIKSRHYITVNKLIKKYEHNNWPELNIIKKSLQADKLLEAIDINSMSEEKQLAALRNKTYIITDIINPSIKIQKYILDT